jgi:hypothetical protein
LWAATPSFDAATTVKDGRHAWFVRHYGQTCWELDALNPVFLRDAVTDCILDRIDSDAWRQYEYVEQAERESLIGVMAQWKSALRSQGS